MWVVRSMDPETDLKPGDIRRKLIEHPEILMDLSLARQQRTTDGVGV